MTKGYVPASGTTESTTGSRRSVSGWYTLAAYAFAASGYRTACFGAGGYVSIDGAGAAGST